MTEKLTLKRLSGPFDVSSSPADWTISASRMPRSGHEIARSRSYVLTTMKDDTSIQSQHEPPSTADEMAPARGAVLGTLLGACLWAFAFGCWKCAA